jgi:hypothetical protein
MTTTFPQTQPTPPAVYPAFPGRGKHPPKPSASAWVTVPELPTGPLVEIPAEPLKAWRQLWHAMGSSLPWYINHSRATRRAMRRTLHSRG